MATVTITGDTVRDSVGRKDNRPWYAWAAEYQDGNPGVVTPRESKPLTPSNGVLTFDIEAGIAAWIQNPDGQRYLVTIPDDDADLWGLIEAGVAYPPETSQEQLNAAVANAAPGFIAAELEAQTADAVTADIEQRGESVIPGDTPGTVRKTWGSAVSAEFPAVTGLWEGIADRDNGVKKATGGIVPIERFNPGVDFAAALSGAINESDATGGTVTLETGKVYTATAGLAVTDKNVRINFNGAKIVRGAAGADFSVLSVLYTTSAVQSVVAITSQIYDWGVGSSDTTPVSRIELSSTAGWAVGDYAVIVGDDAIPGANPSRANQFDGERFRVAGVSGNYLYAARPLRVTLSTNVRIARMTQRDVLLIDPWVEDEPGSPAARNDPAITVQGAVKPRVIGGRMRNLQGEGIQFAGCSEGVIGGEFEATNLRTSEAHNAFGYGVRLLSCCDFDVRGLRGAFTRHLFTTAAGQAMTANSPDLHRYGSNLGHRTEGVGGETGHAAFDLHEEAAYCDIDGAHVAFSHREPLGTKAAFQLRGRNNSLLNSSSKGGAGLSIIGYTGGANFKVSNYMHSILPGMAATDTYGIQSDCSNMSSRGKVDVSGVQLYGPGMVGNMVRLTKTAMRASRLDIVAYNNAAYSPFSVVNLIADSEFICDELFLDLRGISGTVRAFVLADSTSVVRVNRLVVLTGGAAWSIGSFSNFDGSINIGQIETDAAPSSTPFTGIGAGATYSIGDVVVNQQSIRDGINYRINGTTQATGATATLGIFSDATQILDVPISPARTITEASTAIHAGFERLYVRTANATGAVNWNIGGDALTTPGTWLRRMWTGTAWVTVARGFLTAAATGSAALNFPSVAAQSFQDLTIGVTGAVVGDSVSLGIPTAAVTPGIAFTAWVSAADQVTVRAHNYTAGALDPANGTFKATVVR